MPKLKELAKVKSKVAGPFQITFDIMCKDVETYNSIKQTGVINPELFSRLYNVKEDECKFAYYDNGWAMKCTIPRSIVAGNVGDWDLYGEGGALLLQNVDIPL
jgi:hypothetical protein